ncbi:MAG: glycosyltransferase family 2 protein, partial [Candidatus Uhrbacteria bacterium]|nr:glycosyltransferase family 2 protein [Candidatus Uhrbacteria bacterium]
QEIMRENKKTNAVQWMNDVSDYLNKPIPLPPILDLEKWIADLRKRNSDLPRNSLIHEKKISVIIPAWNEEEYIGTALDALLQQSFPRNDFEIIVIDNVSTDQTSTIARQRGADRVVFEPCKGTNSARQRGIQEAQGEIVAFLDADCVPPTDWLEKIYTTLHKRESKCAAIAGSYVFHVDPIDHIFFAQEAYRWIVMPAMASIFGRVLQRGGVLIGGNFASFRENFQRINGLDTSYTFFGDDASIAKKFGEIGYVEFDPTLYVVTSDRRFLREGLIKTNWEYTKNFLKVMFHS